MRDASRTPRAFKKYYIDGEELKEALRIDWPGQILAVDKEYGRHDGFTITMFVQPHELSGPDRDRLTTSAVVPVPVPDPRPAPAKTERKRRWHW